MWLVLNATRISNFFIEIRVDFYWKTLIYHSFCVLERVLSEHENREDVFIHQSRYMNTTFQYNSRHMRLQMLAESYNPAFDGGGPHCKTEYILLHTFGSVVLKDIPVDMLLPF